MNNNNKGTQVLKLTPMYQQGRWLLVQEGMAFFSQGLPHFLPIIFVACTHFDINALHLVVYDATLNSLLNSRRVQLDQTAEMLEAQSAFPNS
jgi:hypothetical protein